MASGHRAQFSSRLGFILAAAGSAVGLGNIWGFPTQAASNGGAVFLITYLIMVFVLAYPLLVAELTIGRFGASNPIRSLMSIAPKQKLLASSVGIAGMLGVSGILSFYAIVAGWFFGFLIGPVLSVLGFESAAAWLEGFGTARNIVLMLVFMLLTIFVVRSGVTDGIEKWSSRLMPVLFILFVSMVAYTLLQDGAMEGLKMYLVPDMSHFSPDLMVSAMGQAFFSLSIGVCTMMVYGSYLRKDADIPKTAAQVALLDTGVAFVAGLLILPAMFVAQNNGVEIYSDAGALLDGDTLVFSVLPAMFDTMGGAGLIIGIAFFALMVIAALTSSISMLEVPVSCASEELNKDRKTVVWWIGGAIALFSTLIILNFGSMFGLVISVTTEYMQPILGLIMALIAGWIWKRNQVLEELSQGNPELKDSLFWKIWPTYVRVVCPILMALVFLWPVLK
ncbi:transporter [Enterovibrio norvegicus]|uniref:Sodium-dependent transporter n=1 Tax=Enterovibrio norvegicus TaxID=188144 RepID=A0ABV4KXW7_9GAMM|nr:sodium-dependent transporter [Enterovibrio norvegicus]OEE44484.1 transporter [Enterovibrio norvegicus]OEF49934.1 transporter [Enterovibrio norvegicus]OEF58469.1 transporter [Enterovibrio norvegicus]PMI27131.1 transporter [Enterovibrio norvegicus]TKF11832.1 sodium-dependent transporter [Enterovibrio norvegicus]